MNAFARTPAGIRAVPWMVLLALALLSGARLGLDGDAAAVSHTVDVPNAAAATQADMKPYTDILTGTSVTFDMVPIHGGHFLMGSPADEPNRNEDEGPLHEVVVDPFWMGRCEVTWDEYENWMFSLEIARRPVIQRKPTPIDLIADAVTRPTKPYTDMSFGMGKEGYPAICMTQLAAKTYCEWLSAKTGRYYRVPTEAEWEYACRAGTTTAYSFGEDAKQLGDYAWYFENSNDAYHQVSKKKPNPWGLYDIYGNVAEWCLDQYVPDLYQKLPAGAPVENPMVACTKRYPRVARGGSWDDDPELLRSAARRGSDREWSVQDPQIPQSIWYHTDAKFVGFRVVRPLRDPTREQRIQYGPDRFQQ
jgi:formylglycine-generating enzyme required for sulfatase activity